MLASASTEVAETLKALEYAHGATGPDGRPLGVIHCDVSPSNFFVSRTGDLKLGDFGVARSLIEGGTEHVMGKPYEQLLKQNHRSLLRTLPLTLASQVT